MGRDHAGVGDYYEAQEIFKNFTAEELGITPLFFEHSFFCTTCGNMASSKTCRIGGPSDLVGYEGSRLASRGAVPPPEFTRPEVAQVLIEGMKEQITV